MNSRKRERLPPVAGFEDGENSAKRIVCCTVRGPNPYQCGYCNIMPLFFCFGVHNFRAVGTDPQNRCIYGPFVRAPEIVNFHHIPVG